MKTENLSSENVNANRVNPLRPVWASGIEDTKLIMRVKVAYARELTSRSSNTSQGGML